MAAAAIFSPPLILASTSPYRRGLLQTLRVPFHTVNPASAEDHREGELPAGRAARLAQDKAVAGAKVAKASGIAGDIIIGSDQVASLNGAILSKPGNHELAIDQLSRSSGRWVTFDTGLCLVDRSGEVLAATVDTFAICFRDLSLADITAYLTAETPYDCAGSIKAEGLGIALIRSTRGTDINTLYGLPLIALVSLLQELNFNILNNIK